MRAAAASASCKTRRRRAPPRAWAPLAPLAAMTSPHGPWPTIAPPRSVTRSSAKLAGVPHRAGARDDDAPVARACAESLGHGARPPRGLIATQGIVEQGQGRARSRRSPPRRGRPRAGLGVGQRAHLAARRAPRRRGSRGASLRPARALSVRPAARAITSRTRIASGRLGLEGRPPFRRRTASSVGLPPSTLGRGRHEASRSASRARRRDPPSVRDPHDRVRPGLPLQRELGQRQRRASGPDALERDDHPSSRASAPGTRLRTTMSDAATTGAPGRPPPARRVRRGGTGRSRTPARTASRAAGMTPARASRPAGGTFVQGARKPRGARATTRTTGTHRGASGRRGSPSPRGRASRRTQPRRRLPRRSPARYREGLRRRHRRRREPRHERPACDRDCEDDDEAAHPTGGIGRRADAPLPPESDDALFRDPYRRARRAPPTASVVPTPQANACDAITGRDARPGVPRIAAAAAMAPSAPSAASAQAPRGPSRRAP